MRLNETYCKLIASSVGSVITVEDIEKPCFQIAFGTQRSLVRIQSARLKFACQLTGNGAVLFSTIRITGLGDEPARWARGRAGSLGSLRLSLLKLLEMCRVENFGWVQGLAAGAVFDLLTATHAGGDDHCIR